MHQSWILALLFLDNSFAIVNSFVAELHPCCLTFHTKRPPFLQERAWYRLARNGIRLQSKIDHSNNNGFDIDSGITRGEAESLTVPQLKQQLRLRGMKVSGRKEELIDRLLACDSDIISSSSNPIINGNSPPISTVNELVNELPIEEKSSDPSSSFTKARDFARANGKELIDVDAYLEEEDQGKSVKTVELTSSMDDLDADEPDGEKARDVDKSGPEVWGAEAKIVEDYEGRSPIVDSLSRTIVEFKGSNQTMVQAYVVASRDALKPFLMGGTNETASAAEDRLREIQMQREKAAKRPVRFEDDEGVDEGDETNLYANILHRDFSDWGKFTLTGAQLSAQEVQGVLLLSDVHGAFEEDTKALAEKIAFECQPVVVMIPDLFRGNQWKEDPSTPGFNKDGKDYEEWRSQHPDLRVSVDIRAAAACLRKRYCVSSIVLWGTCYGGGRALEAAAGFLPGGNIHDVDGTVGPVNVNPLAVVAWYPTRYNAKQLFGPERITPKGDSQSMAVMGVFAGNDHLAGATPADAAELKEALDSDERIKDHMVKVFPNQDHGFAHIGLSGFAGVGDTDYDRFVDEEFGGSGRVAVHNGDAEVACLLSTAFMETYSRVFLPTTGPPIKQEGWDEELEMQKFESSTRDVRAEIEEAMGSFVEEPLGGRRFDPTDKMQRNELEVYLRSLERDDASGANKIEEDDDLEIIYAKLKAADDKFGLF